MKKWKNFLTGVAFAALLFSFKPTSEGGNTLTEGGKNLVEGGVGCHIYLAESGYYLDEGTGNFLTNGSGNYLNEGSGHYLLAEGGSN